MKILAISDEEDKALWDYYRPDRLDGVELILGCGDLNRRYLEFICTMARCPVLYIHGNHDRSYLGHEPEGCIDIEDQVYDYKGLRILGLGGSMRYIPDRPFMYDESEMQSRIRRAVPSITFHNGFDILMTHSPARGYGDMEDLPHQGFACFNALLERYRPKYMIHGHVHPQYDRTFVREMPHASGTTILNVYGKHRFEIGPEDYPSNGKTGSFLYDLYRSLQNGRK